MRLLQMITQELAPCFYSNVALPPPLFPISLELSHLISFTPSLSLVPPSAPRNLNVTGNGTSFIQLAWEGPEDDGNSTILGYYANCTTLTGTPHTAIQFLEIDMNVTSNTTVNNTCNVTQTCNVTTVYSLNVTELHPGEMYSCNVFANNFAGNGTPSDSVTASLANNGKRCITTGSLRWRTEYSS